MHTVIVRPPKTALQSEEDYELAVHAIARMVAQWWAANGHETADTEIGGKTPNPRERLADQVKIAVIRQPYGLWPG